MSANKLAVIVPVDGLPKDNVQASQEIWGAVTNLLQPGLGKLYSRFNPSFQAWGCPAPPPYGVVLGRKDPEFFLPLYLAALQARDRAMAYHAEMLLKNTDISQAGQLFEDTLVCVVDAGSNDAQIAHASWYLGFQEGELLPDCGLYYLSQGKSGSSKADERKVLGNPAGYALCLVALELMEPKEEGD